MNDIITFLRNYDYDICLAKGTKWTLEESVNYLAAYLANKQSWSDRDNAYEGFTEIKIQIAAAVINGLNEGGMVIDEVYKDNGSSDIDFRKSTVLPFIFIKWAIDKNIEVPKQYEKYVDINKGVHSLYYERLGVKKSTVHHERCRAVAELLWRIHPDMPIAEMARREEIIEIGCEGHHYDMRTISRWLANLKTDRKPGRIKTRITAKYPVTVQAVAQSLS